MREALGYRGYRIFVASGAFNFTSFAMQNVVRAWLLTTLTDSPFLISLTVVATLAPLPVFSIFGGILADRFDRKHVVLAGDVFYLMNSAVLITLTALGVVVPWHVIAISLANGVAFALASSSRQTMYSLTIPPHLIKPAAEFYALVFNVGGLLGPAIAFFTLPAWGIVASMVITASLKLVSVAVLLFIEIRHPAKRNATNLHNVLVDLRDGVRFSFKDIDLRMLLTLLVVVGVSVGSFRAILPVLARDELMTSDAGFAALSFYAGFGAIAGALAVVVLDAHLRFRRDGYLLGLLGCGAIVGLAYAPSFWVASVAVSAVGFMLAAFLALNVSSVAAATPDHLRGRVVSVRFVLMGLTSAGALAVGALAEAVAAPLAIAVMALGGVGLLALVFIAEHIHGISRGVRRGGGAGVKRLK